jgi:hypothetical protein
MRRTKRLSKRFHKKNRTFKHKKGGRWFYDRIFRKKEKPDYSFRSAITAEDEDYKDFREKMDTTNANISLREKDYIDKLKFDSKNKRIDTLDEEDLNPENFPDFVPQITAELNEKRLKPTEEDKMFIKPRNRTSKKSFRFNPELERPYVFEEDDTLIPNVSRIYKTNKGYGGRKNNTRKRRKIQNKK